MRHPDQAPQQAPRQEIHLPHYAPVPPRPPRARRGVSNLGLALIAVLITVAAALTRSPIQRPAAEQTVRSFLEYVRAGDVDAALERIDDPPSGPFLTPEALNADWEIVEVAQVGYEGDADGARAAEVYAEILAEDGTRLAHRYEVVFGAGEPLIAERLTGGGVYSRGVFEVNGVPGPIQDPYLLPGVYHFYGSVPSGIDMNMPSMLVLGDKFIELGGEHASDRLTEPRPEFTEEGEAAVAEALHDYLDRCATAPSESCPFYLSAGVPFVEADRSEPWRVTEYPEVAPEGWMLEGGLRLRTVVAGSVEFDVVPADSDGGAEPITASCTFGADDLLLSIDSETGALTVKKEVILTTSCEWLSE